MCNAWNHLPGCCCGWGGYGHHGRSHCLSLIVNDSSKVIPVVQSHGKGVYRWSLFYDDFTKPAICPICNKNVFFIRHNGGSVWLDNLGAPWPKHGCFDTPLERYNSMDAVRLNAPKNYLVINTTQAFVTSLQSSGIDTENSKIGILTEVKMLSVDTCSATVNYGRSEYAQIKIYEKLDHNKFVGSVVLCAANNVYYACINSDDGVNCTWKTLTTKLPLVSTKSELNWGLNDYVHHVKFGVGKIIKQVQVEGDVKLTVQFLNKGTRTILLSFSSLEKVDKYDYEDNELLVVCNNFAQWLNIDAKLDPLCSRVELSPLKTFAKMDGTAYHLTDKLKSQVWITVGSKRYIRDMLLDVAYCHALFIQERDALASREINVIGRVQRARDISVTKVSKYLELINKVWPHVSAY